MKLTEINVWQDFVYKVLYPAVLGAMLYEILKTFSIAALSVVIFYCLDYLHLHNNLDTDKPENATIPRLVVDAGIAILFGIASSRITFEGYGISMGCLLGVCFLILVYTPPANLNTFLFNASNAFLFILVVGIFLFGIHYGITNDWQMRLLYPIPTLVYAVHALRITPRILKESANSGAS